MFNRQYLSLYRFIPSIITLIGMSIGLLGVRYALEENFQYSVLCILIAALCDALDGRMARLLKASSKFGAELDSLSDLTVFGIVPAMILYYWQLQHMGDIGWAIATIYAMACAIRLARFNVSNTGQTPPYSANFFQGVPAPAAACVVLVPLVIGFVFDYKTSVIAVGAWTLCVALLMVSSLPTFSFKKINISRKAIPVTLLAIACVIGGILAKPWIVLMVIAVSYILSFPISLFWYRRMKRQYQQILDAQNNISDL